MKDDRATIALLSVVVTAVLLAVVLGVLGLAFLLDPIRVEG